MNSEFAPERALRDEAAALGIAGEYYDEMIESIESTNETIRRAKIENPDARFRRVLPGQALKASAGCL